MPTNAIQIIRDEHMAVAAMLHSLDKLVAMGPGSKPQRFFEVVRAMLFYVDEFPERRHHPNETKYLFPLVARGAPELQAVIDRLEADHASGEQRVRELQHLLTAWEMLGESRREAFAAALHTHVRFYLQHMRTEEVELLPVIAPDINGRAGAGALREKVRQAILARCGEPDTQALPTT